MFHNCYSGTAIIFFFSNHFEFLSSTLKNLIHFSLFVIPIAGFIYIIPLVIKLKYCRINQSINQSYLFIVKVDSSEDYIHDIMFHNSYSGTVIIFFFFKSF
jgi:cbb3-type cytochrome oxidase cytochrome c subunit